MRVPAFVRVCVCQTQAGENVGILIMLVLTQMPKYDPKMKC